MPFAPFNLTSKTVLITGGNGGIGLGMAEGLAQAGANIVIWGTNEDKNCSASETLRAYGGEVEAACVDVGHEDAVIAAVEDAIDRFGRIDGCIANAGMGGRPTNFEAMELEDFRRVQTTNLEGTFLTLRAVAKHMKERANAGDPGGSLIGVSSTSVLMGAPRGQHYAASKGAITAMIKGIAVEYARYGVRANTLLPGWTMTDMARPALESESFKRKVMPRTPVRRWGQPEDFAGIAIYLMSDASSYHTGQEIVICGGYTVF
ncbi:MAG: SDR family oxidoreductase [Parasphingopyxis sp.]|uniref:SDR family NAD(P)-dependent oxidoreductase n=1 Tax=Parasphingopyxis sp. TaxID=1920299 RepID=UPI0032EFED9A